MLICGRFVIAWLLGSGWFPVAVAQDMDLGNATVIDGTRLDESTLLEMWRRDTFLAPTLAVMSLLSDLLVVGRRGLPPQ